MRIICKCGGALVGKATRCSKCQSAYVKDWRKANPRTTAELSKERTRELARDAFKRGKIVKKPCVNCGLENSEMHHEDYSYPFDVIWLCRSCHLDLHYPDRHKPMESPSSWRTPMPTKLDTWLRQNFVTSQMFADAVNQKTGVYVSRRTVEGWRQGRSCPRFKMLPAITDITHGKVKARDFVRGPVLSEAKGSAA